MEARRIRLAVIGLGRTWETRDRPALARLADRFEVIAVYDQGARRAEIVANQVGCLAAESLAGLAENPQLDAVALLAPQWFGPYPIELMARAGKAIYAGVALPEDGVELDRLDATLRSTGTGFMPGFAPRFAPATVRIRELIDTSRGQVVQIRGTLDSALFDLMVGSSGPIAAESMQAVVDWCRQMTGCEVVTVEARPTGDQPSFVADLSPLGSTPTSEVVLTTRPPLRGDESAEPPRSTIEVTDGRITAWYERPDRIRWADGSAVHDESLTGAPPVTETLLAEFSRLVRGQVHSAPGWPDALAAARVAGAIRASGDRAGGRVHLMTRPTRVAPQPDDEP